MIISHSHQFIFIKTYKTASSSMEIALSSVLEPEDVITPAHVSFDAQRTRGAGGQNYRLDHPDVPKRPLLKRLLGRPERYYHPSVGYYEHMPAWRVKRYIGDDIWRRYYKFAFERNPWDRQVSYYYYKNKTRQNRPEFADFMRLPKKKWYVENHDLYTIDGEMALDFVGRYEQVEADFDKVLAAIGLSGQISLPKANVSKKKKTSSYRDYYTDELVELVRRTYAPEIARFGYEF